MFISLTNAYKISRLVQVSDLNRTELSRTPFGIHNRVVPKSVPVQVRDLNQLEGNPYYYFYYFCDLFLLLLTLRR